MDARVAQSVEREALKIERCNLVVMGSSPISGGTSPSYSRTGFNLSLCQLICVLFSCLRIVVCVELDADGQDCQLRYIQCALTVVRVASKMYCASRSSVQAR